MQQQKIKQQFNKKTSGNKLKYSINMLNALEANIMTINFIAKGTQ